jgi:hypothetical protein
MIYGEHGSGKTTLASTFPKPVIVDIEGGSDDLDVARTDRIKSLDDIQTAMSYLITTQNDFSTIVYDSLDWLYSLITKRVQEHYSEKERSYGKEFSLIADEFRNLLPGFRRLNDLGKANVFLCHAKNDKVLPTNGDAYHKTMPDLHAETASLMMEFCDEVLFLSKKVFTRSEDLGFNRTRQIAIGTEERYFVTCDTGGITAKNRLSMPPEIPATFEAYASYIKTTGGNIDGIVKDGSSKQAT